MRVVSEDTDDQGGEPDRDETVPEGLAIPSAPDDSALDDTDPNAEFSSLLRELDDGGGLDDEIAGDMVPGEDVGDAPDLVEDADGAPIEADHEIELPPEGRSLLVGADELGPTGDVGGSDAIEAPPISKDDDGEGVLNDDLVPPDPEHLDTSSADDEEPAQIPLEELGFGAGDDALPGSLAWVEVPIPHGPPRSVVVAARGSIIAAGTDVAALDDSGAATILAANVGDDVTSLLATSDGSIFYATRRGELFRVAARGHELIVAWKQVFDLGHAEQTLDLGGMTPSSRPALLLRAGSRRKELLESTDHGSSFRRVHLGGAIVALSKGAPPVCVVKTERSVRLLRSEPTGGFSVACADWPFDTENQTIVTEGDTVGALDPDRGIRVSADGGRSLRTVAGLSGASVLGAGRVGGRPVVFAALFDTEAESSKIAYIDAATGDAVLIASVDSSDDEADGYARVSSLAWNEHTETLWAAGLFGLRCFRRPTSA